MKIIENLILFLLTYAYYARLAVMILIQDYSAVMVCGIIKYTIIRTWKFKSVAI